MKGASMLIKRKQILVLVLSVIGIVSIAELGRYAFQAQTRPPVSTLTRARWEYCTVNMVTPGSGGWKAQVSRGLSVENVDSDITGISTVNKLGLEDWELVSVVHEKGNSVEYFLKRPMR
jgi:hypothetical protein